MTLHSSRSASLSAVALAIAFVASLAAAQSSPQVDNPTAAPMLLPADFVVSTKALPSIPMPQDRAADSYRIYSVLLPVGELNDPGWPRDLWLLSDTTLTLVPSDQPCSAQDVGGINMNPHLAVEPPTNRVDDYRELLEDFDRTCHQRIQLTPESFNLIVPLRLLNQSEQDEFIRKRFDPNVGREGDVLTARYKGASGLSRFSQVYFNAHHTVAMVYASGWCGGLCAQSYWQVLGLEDGAWKRLGWRTSVIMN